MLQLFLGLTPFHLGIVVVVFCPVVLMSHYCFAWKSSLLFSSLLVLVVCCSDSRSRLLRIRRTSVPRTGIPCFFLLALLESCLASSSRDLFRVASSRQHFFFSFLFASLRRHANTASLLSCFLLTPNDVTLTKFFEEC